MTEFENPHLSITSYITLRDLFAGFVIAGVYSREDVDYDYPDNSDTAYRQADAMIEYRKLKGEN